MSSHPAPTGVESWAADASDADVEFAKVFMARMALQDVDGWGLRSLWHSLTAAMAEELDRRAAVVRELRMLEATPPQMPPRPEPLDDSPPDAA